MIYDQIMMTPLVPSFEVEKLDQFVPVALGRGAVLVGDDRIGVYVLIGDEYRLQATVELP